MEGRQGSAAEEHGDDYLESRDGTWSTSITRCTWPCARRRDVKQARRWRSSLADREGRSKRGSGLDPSGTTRARRRSQAAHPGRHAGAPVERCRSPADIQDRDGAFHLPRRARRLFPFIERIFAVGAYAGRKMAMTVWRTGAWRLQIVKRSDAAGFEVLPKRWIVERTFASMSRNRRLARDFSATSRWCIFRLAMIRIMLRRCCKCPELIRSRAVLEARVTPAVEPRASDLTTTCRPLL